jgi:hypothetical protein
MRHTVTGLVEKPIEAQRIIDELMSRCLSDRSDISLIAQDTAGMGAGVTRTAGQLASAAGMAAKQTVSELFKFATETSRQVPGFGVLKAFGQLGAMLSRRALATAEDVAKAFADFGIEHDLARKYADALKQGQVLIIVDAKTDNMAQCARQVLATHGTVSPESRAAP